MNLGSLFKSLGKTVMSANPIGAAITGIGVLDSLNKARVNGSRASGFRREAYDASVDALMRGDKTYEGLEKGADRIYGIADKAVTDGTFNADKRIAGVKSRMTEELGDVQQMTAQKARLLGYKPGDSLPVQNLRSQAGNYANKIAQMYDQFKLEQAAREMATLSSGMQPKANIADRRMNIGLQRGNVAQGQSNYYQSQTGNLGGALAPLMPFLEPQQTSQMGWLSNPQNYQRMYQGLGNLKNLGYALP